MTRRPVSPAAQIAGFIAKFDPAIARLVRAARTAMRKRFPAAHELVYDNYNALAIGHASSERTSDVIASLPVYASGLNLYFYYGARLPDPHAVLLGSGSQGRFVRIKSVADLDAPAVRELLREADRRARVPLAGSGRGRTIIKSISAKQRPRRSRSA